jgi:hypothetical protein
MHFRVIPALLLALLLFPASLPADDATEMRAENLSDTTPFTQPFLLAVANLDQRISTATDAVDRAGLTHQRALVLEQLNRTILFQGGNGFAAPLPAHELQRLRDAVSSARRSGEKTAEMTAILRLNSAILSQSFTDLLTTVARDWIRFAPAADFKTLGVIDSLYVVLVVWALLRLIDNFVTLYSSELLRRYPSLRGELVNFLSSMTRFLVIVIAILFLMQHFGFDIRAMLIAHDDIADNSTDHHTHQVLLLSLIREPPANLGRTVPPVIC